MAKEELLIGKIHPPTCFVCGGKGLVPYLYVNRNAGTIEGKRLVPCPKCRKPS